MCAKINKIGIISSTFTFSIYILLYIDLLYIDYIDLYCIKWIKMCGFLFSAVDRPDGGRQKLSAVLLLNMSPIHSLDCLSTTGFSNRTSAFIQAIGNIHLKVDINGNALALISGLSVFFHRLKLLINFQLSTSHLSFNILVKRFHKRSRNQKSPVWSVGRASDHLATCKVANKWSRNHGYATHFYLNNMSI